MRQHAFGFIAGGKLAAIKQNQPIAKMAPAIRAPIGARALTGQIDILSHRDRKRIAGAVFQRRGGLQEQWGIAWVTGRGDIAAKHLRQLQQGTRLLKRNDGRHQGECLWDFV